LISTELKLNLGDKIVVEISIVVFWSLMCKGTITFTFNEIKELEKCCILSNYYISIICKDTVEYHKKTRA